MGSRMDWSLQGPLPHPQRGAWVAVMMGHLAHLRPRWWLFRAVAPNLARGPEFYLDLPSLEDLL